MFVFSIGINTKWTGCAIINAFRMKIILLHTLINNLWITFLVSLCFKVLLTFCLQIVNFIEKIACTVTVERWYDATKPRTNHLTSRFKPFAFDLFRRIFLAKHFNSALIIIKSLRHRHEFRSSINRRWREHTQRLAFASLYEKSK